MGSLSDFFWTWNTAHAKVRASMHRKCNGARPILTLAGMRRPPREGGDGGDARLAWGGCTPQACAAHLTRHPAAAAPRLLQVRNPEPS